MPTLTAATTVLALTADERTMWYIALGIGAVVVVVVIALLSLLVSIVGDIDEGVKGVWRSAKRLAANTATSWQLKETAATLEEIRHEVELHDEMLEERL